MCHLRWRVVWGSWLAFKQHCQQGGFSFSRNLYTVSLFLVFVWYEISHCIFSFRFFVASSVIFFWLFPLMYFFSGLDGYSHLCWKMCRFTRWWYCSWSCVLAILLKCLPYRVSAFFCRHWRSLLDSFRIIHKFLLTVSVRSIENFLVISWN